MTGRLKILAVTLMVAAALSAVSASMASGEELHSGSASGTTYLTAEQILNSILAETPAGNVKCSASTAKGQYAGITSAEATLTEVKFSGCTPFGLTGHVEAMGCDYLVKGGGETSGTLHVVCPETGGGVKDEITVTATQGGVPVCTLEIPAQAIEAEFKNTGAAGEIPEDFDIIPSASKITYSVTYSPADHTKTKCGTQGLHHDGKYTGSTTVTGFGNEAHTQRAAVTYASAVTPPPEELHSGSESGTTYLTAEQILNSILAETPAGNVKCSAITAKGQYAGTTSAEATLTEVKFSGCTAFGLTGHVEAMGCDYLVKGGGETSGTLHVVCPETGGGVKDEITVTATQGGVPVCTLEIPAQAIEAEFKNTGAAGEIPEDFDIIPSASTITYSVTYSPADHTKTKCGTQGLHHDGKYTGSTTVTGFFDEEHRHRVGVTYAAPAS